MRNLDHLLLTSLDSLRKIRPGRASLSFRRAGGRRAESASESVAARLTTAFPPFLEGEGGGPDLEVLLIGPKTVAKWRSTQMINGRVTGATAPNLHPLRCSAARQCVVAQK